MERKGKEKKEREEKYELIYLSIHEGNGIKRN